jgi:iron complex transport system permease protein
MTSLQAGRSLAHHCARPSPQCILLSLLALLIAMIILSCAIGAVSVPPLRVLSILLGRTGLPLPDAIGSDSVDLQAQAVVWSIRLPRVVLGVCVGAGLALSGVALQGLFRNPLADPGLIGVSSGAAFGAAAVIVLGATVAPGLAGLLGGLTLPAAAFAGGLAVSLLIYRLALRDGVTAMATMLLAGIAINALAGAAIGAFTYLATDQQLRTLTFWNLGSLGNADWPVVKILVPLLALAVLGLVRCIRGLNALMLGEAEAGHLGVDTQALKRAVIFWSALAVAGAVAFAGMIGFIGLVTPHIVRLLCGSDHRYVMPGAALLGGSLILAADLLARTVAIPAEIPIGILTALLGAPFFLFLLLRQRSHWSL